MACPHMTRADVDYADVQGLVRFGFGRLTQATSALLRVRDVPAARTWLRSAPITSAVTMQPPPSKAMQVAFTAAGAGLDGGRGEGGPRHAQEAQRQNAVTLGPWQQAPQPPLHPRECRTAAAIPAPAVDEQRGSARARGTRR